MDQYETNEAKKQISSVPDIDQLCNLIHESTFGLKCFPPSKFSSVPSTQIKAFRSTRVKRLHKNSNENLFSMRFSLPSSLLNRFRSLSTYNLPKSRRYSSSTITLFRTKSILPSMNEEEINSLSPTQSQLSCSIVDTRRTTANSCNVVELAAYLDNFLYLPKSLSGAAELMYT